MISLLGGVFLGWSLGANDASNIIGTAVLSRMIKFWHAAFLAALFCVLGAVISGQAGIETLRGLTSLNVNQAVISSVAAAVTVTMMTILGLPVSSSQAVVGSVLGIGIIKGANTVRLETLKRIFLAWLFTPVVACSIALALSFISRLSYTPVS